MIEAKNGDLVKVHYTGKIKGGEVFDSSLEREPFEVSLGNGQVITGFENAILGMKVGEEVTVDISPEEGYGPRHEQMIKDQNIFNENGDRLLPEGISAGLTLQGSGSMGEPIQAMILEVTDTTAKLDFNHILAGKDLTFTIKLVELNGNSSDLPPVRIDTE